MSLHHSRSSSPLLLSSQTHSLRSISTLPSANRPPAVEPPEVAALRVDFRTFYATFFNDPTLPPIVASTAREIIRGTPFQTSLKSYAAACKHDIHDEYELTYEKTPELSALIAALANCITTESSLSVPEARRTPHLVYREFGAELGSSSPSPIVGVLYDTPEIEASNCAGIALLMHVEPPPPNSIDLDDLNLSDSTSSSEEQCRDTSLLTRPPSLSPSIDGDSRGDEEVLVSEAQAVMTALGNRRHVLGVIVNGLEISFKYFDRAGSVRTSPLHMLYDVQDVVCAFIALSICDMYQLGLEPSLVPASSSPPSIAAVIGSRILVDHSSFVIERVLHSSNSLYGRGTVVFAAQTIRESGATIDQSNETANSAIPNVVIAKLSWQVTTHESEDEMFKIAAHYGVEGIAKLYKSCVSGRLSGGMRGLLFGTTKNYVDRELRVQIMGPLCTPLYREANIDHFKSAFISLVQAHRQLYEKAGILHRDISINNLMVDPSRPGNGVLIDLDLAVRVRDGDRPLDVKPSVTGTTPFLSVDLMEKRSPANHFYRHDLESFLYVLSWIVVHYRDGQFVPTDMLRAWYKEDWDVIRMVKRGFLFNPRILIRTALIGSPLEAWILKLARLFGRGYWAARECAPCVDETLDGIVTYDAFVDVLQHSS